MIQKVATPWTVIRQGKRIVSAFPQGKSTLDFRGTVKNGVSISFDCKETNDLKGLPLSNVQPHQIEYMRTALKVGEVTFLIVHMKKLDRYFVVQGDEVIHKYDRWQNNKGRRGFNKIFIEDMQEIKRSGKIALNYLAEVFGVK